MSAICLKILIASILARFFYWGFFFSRLIFHRVKNERLEDQKYNVVVCVKDGIEHLGNINLILRQKALRRLILVDDFSNQETTDALSKLQESQIDLISAKEDVPGKKQALTEGVTASDLDNLVLTDIDCSPASDEWGSIMASNLTAEKEIVLGYGPYRKLTGFLNKFIRFETVMTATQYFSYALAGIPYMGVGRNIAYKKSLFDRVSGLENHKHIISGDDDLFVRDAATKENTQICLHPKTFCYSEPSRSLKMFINQKSRHISTSGSYKMGIKILLGIYALSHIMFYISFFCLLFTSFRVAISSYLGFMLITILLFYIISKRFKESDLAFWFPALDLIYFIYFIFMTPFLIFKRAQW